MSDLSASYPSKTAVLNSKELGAAETFSNAQNLGATPHDFWILLKPRVMYLVVFTALVGLLRAPGELDPLLAAIAIFCIALGAGAAGAYNMGYDVDIDRLMARTAQRPTALGTITPSTTYVFATILSIGAISLLGLAVNWLAAALLAFTIWFYAGFYTMWLKRATPQNIVIGGAAGAFPPMIGWLAMSGSLSLEPVLLFLIIFFWTPPHFWALALLKIEDYDRANIPMLPNMAGTRVTQIHILLYSVVLSISALSPSLFGMTGWVYTAISAIMSSIFMFGAYMIYSAKDETALRPACKKLFAFSIVYLFVIFVMLMIDIYLPSPFGSRL